MIGVKNGLKGLYLFEGIPFPEGNWSNALISRLRALKYRPVVEFKVQELLDELEFFRARELKARAEIRKFCRADQELSRCIHYLMSLPGVGWIVSSYVLGALGGYKHLSSVKKTSGFLGLGACENSTGERIRRGQITAVGDSISLERD
jgi:transposase